MGTKMAIPDRLKLSPFKIGCLVILAACLIFHSFGNQKPALLTALDNRVTDAMFRWRGPVKDTGSVVIVDIDEKSLRKIGQWPWPRNTVAQLIRQILAAGPRVLGLDIMFVEQDRTSPSRYMDELQRIFNLKLPSPAALAVNPEILNHDLALGNAVAAGPTVLGYAFQLYDDGLKNPQDLPFPSCQIRVQPNTTPFRDLALIKAYRGVVNIMDVAQGLSEGFFNVIPDPSGTIRKVPLLMMLDDIPYPSLALEMFRVGMNQIEYTIHASHQIKTPATGLLGITVGERFIPTDDNGQLAVNFRGPAKSFPYLSAVEILRGQHRPALKDKYVLIGGSAAGLYDLVAVPFANLYSGVEVHASIIDNLIADDPFSHDIFTEIGWTYALIVVGGIFLSLILSYSGPLLGGLGGLLIIAAALVGNYQLFFLEQTLVGVVYPFLSFLLIFLAVSVGNYFFEGREKSFIRMAFGHYVSPRVVSQLIDNPAKLSLKGEQKHLSVLFSDIRGFTTISEQMTSQQLSSFMNEYLTTMSDCIIDHGGTVDKFIGDAIMAIWGAPLDDEEHALHALQAAMSMMAQLKESRQEYADRGLPVIDIGIGINTGIMSVGNFGSRERFDYTVMGDNVNLASRLEGANKEYGTHIIISEFTQNQLDARYYCRFIDKVRVKGKNKAVKIYEPLVEGAPDSALREEVETFEKALADYRKQNFNRAKEVMTALYRANPLKLYAFYLHRINNYLQAPPGRDWDGVERRLQMPDNLITT
ncbi:Adenylate cyclase (EC [Olavius algarvensis Delta 1 endosymbiont]|nr:Adenylate cyclase (EC [Olavius algarvensis Delta 1 endosymbiont]